MKLVWLRQAVDDLNSAVEYLAPRNPSAALALYQTIKEKAARLPEQPGIGRPGRVQGTREFVVYPYIVAYTVHSDIPAVVILRVLHGAQEWPYEFNDD